MCGLYCHECGTPPEHCFLLIKFVSNCKIRKHALLEREILFLDKIDKKKQRNYSTVCCPCVSEPTNDSPLRFTIVQLDTGCILAH